MKKNKAKTNSGVMQRKGGGNKEPIIIPVEGTQEMNKTNESREETNASEKKSNNEETKDPKASISEQSKKEFTILILSIVGAEVIKEGENQENSEEESDLKEEEEEEGKIEMTTP